MMPDRCNSIKVINKFRKSVNLPLIVIKKIPCYACKKIFKSRGRENRFCFDCKTTEIWRNGHRIGEFASRSFE